jgi:hypothetical protein
LCYYCVLHSCTIRNPVVYIHKQTTTIYVSHANSVTLESVTKLTEGPAGVLSLMSPSVPKKFADIELHILIDPVEVNCKIRLSSRALSY